MRVFKYEVTLVAKNDERYFEFDRRCEQAKMWLQWASKRKNYFLMPKKYDSQEFKFATPGLASAFALKFS